MRLFFSDKSIVLFEFLTVGEKRSKKIKGTHHYQGHTSSTRKKYLSHLPSQTISDHGIFSAQPQTLP
jgi:hypothetical protein